MGGGTLQVLALSASHDVRAVQDCVSARRTQTSHSGGARRGSNRGARAISNLRRSDTDTPRTRRSLCLDCTEGIGAKSRTMHRPFALEGLWRGVRQAGGELMDEGASMVGGTSGVSQGGSCGGEWWAGKVGETSEWVPRAVVGPRWTGAVDPDELA